LVSSKDARHPDGSIRVGDNLPWPEAASPVENLLDQRGHLFYRFPTESLVEF